MNGRRRGHGDKGGPPEPRRGYGWLRIGNGSNPRFLVKEDTVHRVRFVVVADGRYSVRCSHRNCSFRRDGVADLSEAQSIAAVHIAGFSIQNGKRRKK